MRIRRTEDKERRRIRREGWYGKEKDMERSRIWKGEGYGKEKDM